MIFKLGILGTKNCHLLVTFFHPYLLVGTGQIQLNESFYAA